MGKSALVSHAGGRTHKDLELAAKTATKSLVPLFFFKKWVPITSESSTTTTAATSVCVDDGSTSISACAVGPNPRAKSVMIFQLLVPVMCGHWRPHCILKESLLVQHAEIRWALKVVVALFSAIMHWTRWYLQKNV